MTMFIPAATNGGSSGMCGPTKTGLGIDSAGPPLNTA